MHDLTAPTLAEWMLALRSGDPERWDAFLAAARRCDDLGWATDVGLRDAIMGDVEFFVRRAFGEVPA